MHYVVPPGSFPCHDPAVPGNFADSPFAFRFLATHDGEPTPVLQSITPYGHGIPVSSLAVAPGQPIRPECPGPPSGSRALCQVSSGPYHALGVAASLFRHVPGSLAGRRFSPQAARASLPDRALDREGRHSGNVIVLRHHEFVFWR
jgi:hypothetical protein